MATCDCEGSDRAYVIVNSGSPDRREILSLNPPICHDTKTKALLINGQLQTFSKEIINTSLSGGGSGGGVRVDWGNGDVDILSGETWNVSATRPGAWFLKTRAYAVFSNVCRCTSFLYTFAPTVVGLRFNAGPAGAGSCDPWPVEAIPQTATVASDPNIQPTVTFTSSSISLQCTNAGVAQPNNIGTATVTWSNGVTLTANNVPQNPILGPNPTPYYLTQTNNTYTVTTNTGQVSQRTQRLRPIIDLLEADPCILTITFDDNTTQEIEYGEECPDVSPIQCLEVTDQGGVLADICPYKGEPIAFSCDERKCPPETCCELDCGGGRVCCYGPDSGAAIDSFIRRT